jgi:hypothetical protein
MIVNIQIIKTRINAKSRTLDTKWRIIFDKWDISADFDWNQFPHVVQVQNHEESLIWCATHIGELDHAWTYKDSDAILFKDRDHATLFSLSL